MQIRFCLFVLLALFASIRAEGTVFVYEGTISRFTDDQPNRQALRCFLVVEPSTSRLCAIVYGKVAGAKLRESAFTFTGILVSIDRGNDQKEQTFSFAQKFETAGVTLGYDSVFFHGLNVMLTTNKVGGVPKVESGPRTLKGGRRYAAFGLGSVYVDDQMSASYSQSRTVLANLANHSLDEVKIALEAELEARGFLL